MSNPARPAARREADVPHQHVKQRDGGQRRDGRRVLCRRLKPNDGAERREQPDTSRTPNEIAMSANAHLRRRVGDGFQAPDR